MSAVCPNCGAIVATDALHCPKCKADFGPYSAWKPITPELARALARQAALIREETRAAQPPNAGLTVKAVLLPAVVSGSFLYAVAALTPTPSGNQVFFWLFWFIFLPLACVVALMHFALTAGLARAVLRLKDVPSARKFVALASAIGAALGFVFGAGDPMVAWLSGSMALLASQTHAWLMLKQIQRANPGESAHGEPV